MIRADESVGGVSIAIDVGTGNLGKRKSVGTAWGMGHGALGTGGSGMPGPQPVWQLEVWHQGMSFTT